MTILKGSFFIEFCFDQKLRNFPADIEFLIQSHYPFNTCMDFLNVSKIKQKGNHLRPKSDEKEIPYDFHINLVERHSTLVTQKLCLAK